MEGGGKREKRGMRRDRDNGGRKESENEWMTRRITESKMVGTGKRGHPRVGGETKFQTRMSVG